ncbi:MAG: hypothetical protein U0271_46655 [Polyangiaceae bacterium]
MSPDGTGARTSDAESWRLDLLAEVLAAEDDPFEGDFAAELAWSIDCTRIETRLRARWMRSTSASAEPAPRLVAAR